jgi:hypothetical protein
MAEILYFSLVLFCSQRSLRTEDVSNLEKEKINISFLKDPGIYEILDVKNNLSYYGETVCLLTRCQLHFRQLLNSTHPCVKLLESFNEQKNPGGFQFFVIASGSEWTDYTKRCQLEKKLIAANSHRCYNQTETKQLNPGPSLIRSLMYKGKQYASVRGAIADRDHVKISRTTLKRQLVNPEVLDVYYIGTGGKPHGSIPVFATKNGGVSVFFPSIRAIVKANFASSKREAEKNLAENISGWRYAHFDKDGKPSRNRYILKEGEISYEMYLENLEEN